MAFEKFMGGFDFRKLKYGIEVEMDAKEAERLFGDIAHKAEDVGAITIHYFIRKSGSRVKVFVKAKYD